MKIEMNEGSVWAAIAVTVATFLAVVICYAIHECQTTNRTAIQSGLVEINNTRETTHWGKP